MPESQGVIRRMIERDGVFMVSFPNHAGYFSIAEGDAQSAMTERIRRAAESGETISFRFDARLQITEIF
ncbi:MAG: hypothetical protein RBS08_00365 [Bdellovibrionales bacterium]|nr:hypothetical protein [Bdellovibrionales bacterium]